MPMIWNAEADAKLLARVFQMADVKLSTAQYQELAKVMGQECTPKSIMHRMTHFRKGTASYAKGAKGSPNGTKKVIATPTKGAKGAKADPMTPAKDSTPRPKRSTPKHDYKKLNGEDTDSDEEGSARKRIKMEESDDSDKDVDFQEAMQGVEGEDE